MKKFFSLLSMLCMSMVVFAQGSLLATLSHDGGISTFYGAKALQEALAASVNGDVITLSSGTFNAVNIDKAVTIRGAGMEVDSVTNTLPTIISGDFAINIPDAGTSKLTMEGLYHNQKIVYDNTTLNPMFLKCRLYNVTYNKTENRLVNASFIHCKIANNLDLASNSSASCVNSVVTNPYSYSNTTSNFEITNCVVRLTSSSSTSNSTVNRGNASGVASSSLINCAIYIINTSTSYNYFPSTTSLYNNVSNQGNAWRTCPNSTNKTVAMSEVFKTFVDNYSDSESFLLTDEAKTTYLGTDGKEVGIYGGSLPFSPTPTNPQITKCEVAAKSTADGKLSVDIVVNGAE